jgi:hypothetical protein
LLALVAVSLPSPPPIVLFRRSVGCVLARAGVGPRGYLDAN